MKSVMPRIAVAVLALVLVLSGCKKEAPAPTGKPAEPSKPPASSGHHDGPALELGTGTAGPFAIKASRDAGAIKGGGDAPIDVWVTSGPKVTSVRFWLGVADGKGSVKALAEIEDPAQPNHYHTHAEVPESLAAGSKLWVEIEGEGGAKGTASFDLKR